MTKTNLSGLSVILLAICLAGCGSDTSSSDGGSSSTTGEGTGGGAIELPENVLDEQLSISISDWDSVVAQDQDLQQAMTEAAADGYPDVIAAGRIKDTSDNIAYWAVLSKASDGKERIIVRVCDAESACQAGVVTAAGEWAAGGIPLMVAPAMVKDLTDADHEGISNVSAALSVDEVPVVDLRKRRFVLANAFGPAFGVNLSGWKSMAQGTGAFTDVQHSDYVRASVVEDALKAASPFDVMVWVGASVREELGPNHKTIGMTVNRGIYGDETFTASRARDAIKASPFGGPGLIVLVGEETRGDGSSQQDKNLSLFKELSDAESGRIIVAIQGRPGPAKALEASEAFLVAYMTNAASLGEAVATANLILEGTGGELVSSRASIADTTFFVSSLSGPFEGDSPKAVRSTHFINIANTCFPDINNPSDFYKENEGHASFFADVDFDGPFFSGGRVAPEVNLDVTIEGVLLGTEAGDRLYVRISGDLKPSMRGITVWGAGVLQDEFDKDNPGRIFYNGSALTTDYTNDKGDTCVLLSPTLTGATSQNSWLNLP
ncbi:MAG: hypothetical protein ACI9WU_001014 [Myxococcota bacterium]|jgi:hypothetical protein